LYGNLSVNTQQNLNRQFAHSASNSISNEMGPRANIGMNIGVDLGSFGGNGESNLQLSSRGGEHSTFVNNSSQQQLLHNMSASRIAGDREAQIIDAGRNRDDVISGL
jgi:hypothetical protein